MGGFSKIFLEFCYVCISEFAHLKNNIEFAESYVVRSILCARGLIIIISHALAEVSLERLLVYSTLLVEIAAWNIEREGKGRGPRELRLRGEALSMVMNGCAMRNAAHTIKWGRAHLHVWAEEEGEGGTESLGKQSSR